VSALGDRPAGGTAVAVRARSAPRRRRPRVSWLLAAGTAVVAATVCMTILAPVLAPYNPTLPTTLPRLAPPGPGHLLGTDQLQRDVLSRIIYGGRIPLLVALLSTVVSLACGTLLGWVSGYAGGPLDRGLSLAMDALYSFPALILAIAIVAMLGPGIPNMIGAIAFVYIPAYFRVARAQAMVVREREFVEAARALGSSPSRCCSTTSPPTRSSRS
jgi:peptide/nickel transport system permease protein